MSLTQNPRLKKKPDQTFSSGNEFTPKKMDPETENRVQGIISESKRSQAPDSVNQGSGFPKAITGSTNKENTMSKVVDSLIDINNNLPAKSRLDKNEIKMIARAVWYSVKYHTPSLSSFVDFYLQHKISEKGLGRTELVQFSNAVAQIEIAQMKAKEVKL